MIDFGDHDGLGVLTRLNRNFPPKENDDLLSGENPSPLSLFYAQRLNHGHGCCWILLRSLETESAVRNRVLPGHQYLVPRLQPLGLSFHNQMIDGSSLTSVGHLVLNHPQSQEICFFSCDWNRAQPPSIHPSGPNRTWTSDVQVH